VVGSETIQRTGIGLRLCWRCGYRGRELQGPRGDTTFCCPSCNEDLYARPPLSYYEREGFTDREVPAETYSYLFPSKKRRISNTAIIFSTMTVAAVAAFALGACFAAFIG